MSRLSRFLNPNLALVPYRSRGKARIERLASSVPDDGELPYNSRGLEHRYVHARRYLLEEHVISVECSRPCRIFLMSDLNHTRYHLGRDFKALGGSFTRFPAHIQVPRSGVWNILIDLAGSRGELSYSITYMKPRKPAAGPEIRQPVRVIV